MSEQPRVVRRSETAPRPWANGGGTTCELLRADDGSWRVSLADIDRDGPFSTFPGLRRLLAGPADVSGRCTLAVITLRRD